MTTTVTPFGYAIRNGCYAPAMIPQGYFDDMGHLARYFEGEAGMRDDLKAHHNAEAVISIYPAEQVEIEGKPFPLIRQVPGAKALVHYRVKHYRGEGYRWFPLD